MSFKVYRQFDTMDCGPSCLRMIFKHHGKEFSLRSLSKLCGYNREGSSMLGLSNAADKLGFKTIGVKLSIKQLHEAELPCILHWRQNHYVVLYKIQKQTFYIADPAVGRIKLKKADFEKNWLSDAAMGIALLLTPTNKFYEQENEITKEVSWRFLLQYFLVYKKLFTQLLLGLATVSALQLIAPFLTQSIVDVGISTKDLNFIYLILIAQAALIVGRVSVEFVRSWILLHISTRVNVSILSDFLIKLMKLPIWFFDTKMTGDILQRMNDQKNIQTFLTGSTLTTIFSVVNLLVFSVVLAHYNIYIFVVFLVSSFLYSAWIFVFLKQRRILNYKSFEVSAKNQSSIVQLISGMQEIKLNNCERQKRWEWEHIQARLFRFNVKTLALSQYQQGGATFINEGKNVLITCLCAQAVVNDDLTLGAMVAIQYIIGQLNSPIDHLAGFVQEFQDAKISIERLNEIHVMEDETDTEGDIVDNLPKNKSIYLKNIDFSYPGAGNKSVFKNLSLNIPEGKTTAIVGMSGSGKTTILKLLLRFYNPQSGQIEVGNNSLSDIRHKLWRSKCGVVMQEGYIFSDTIEHNIAVGDEEPDKLKLSNAVKIANIQDFIESLPLGLNTRIGNEGNGISQGQRQRILIARAVYKNPEYLFFDEATNALDSNNERIIMNNLSEFFNNRTVVVVAHRLSTVSNADNIIVLDKGQIIEQGTHFELTYLKGTYYSLVKNQLELGN
jgi:ATP-binding cassette subfamily B protein